MNKMKGKCKEWWNENRDAVVGLTVVFGSCVAGYWAGKTIGMYRTELGLQTMFKHDPELETRFWKAIEECKKKS